MLITDEFVWIDAIVVNDTAMAMLLETDAGQIWIPKSQIGVMQMDSQRLEVAAWWAKKNGLVDEKDDQ